MSTAVVIKARRQYERINYTGYQLIASRDTATITFQVGYLCGRFEVHQRHEFVSVIRGGRLD